MKNVGRFSYCADSQEFPSPVNLTDQIAEPDTHRSGNPQQSIHRDRFFPALHFPHVIRVKVRPFRQFLLREPALFPMLPNGSTQKFAMLRDGRHGL